MTTPQTTSDRIIDRIIADPRFIADVRRGTPEPEQAPDVLARIGPNETDVGTANPGDQSR